MRRPGSGAPRDSDVMEVLLVEEETHDDFLDLLHEIALSAAALRAVSPGDPRPDPSGGDHGADGAPVGGTAGRTRGRLLLRRWAAIAAAVLVAVPATSAVIDARSTAAAEARLAAAPEVLRPMTGPPTEVWRGTRPEGATGVDAVGREPARSESRTLPGGSRASWETGPDGEFLRGRVVVRRGFRSYPLPGPVLVPAVTDGSVPRTLVTVTGDGSHLRGIALVTGDRLWSWPRARTGPIEAAVHVDGVVVLDEGSAVTALDVRTGGALWSAPVDPSVGGRALTDGRLVLLPVRDDDGAPQLVARRLADGAEVWRILLPASTTSLSVVDHQLVVAAGDELVGLASPSAP